MKKAVKLPIGDVIQDLREAKSISRLQFGALIFASYQTVRAIEVGDQYPHFDVLEDIAAALDVPMWRIVKEAEERKGARHGY